MVSKIMYQKTSKWVQLLTFSQMVDTNLVIIWFNKITHEYHERHQKNIRDETRCLAGTTKKVTCVRY